jgi:hypothetical protein
MAGDLASLGLVGVSRAAMSRSFVRMPGMMTLPTVLDTGPDLSANEFQIGYITGDGTRHRVPIADVRAVPLEAMVPIRRFNARKGSELPYEAQLSARLLAVITPTGHKVSASR